MRILKYDSSNEDKRSSTGGYRKTEIATTSSSSGSGPASGEELWRKGGGMGSLVPKESFNISEGIDSVAVGTNTETTNQGELAAGVFNKSTVDQTAFSVGDGRDEGTRHNIFEVKKSGTVTAPTFEATTEVKSPLMTADTGDIKHLVSDLVDTKNLNVTVKAIIKELLAENITTDYLTVTKAAHFFKLIIDEIKASKGQIIVTPANAVLDLVEDGGTYWKCYFRASDADGKQIYNSFEADDQVICQTFNAAQGTSYNVSNKFYWRKCTSVNQNVVKKTIDGQEVDCWQINLSKTDCDSGSNANPAAGDEIVMLGNRTDTTRQAAIILSAYNNTYLDAAIKSPSIVQYDGINNFNLSTHRKNVISKELNSFTGKFYVHTSGGDEDIEDVIDDSTTYVHMAWANSADGRQDFTKVNDGVTPYKYLGLCSDKNESDASLIYSDYRWSIIKGADGTDGVTITDTSVTYQVSDSGTVVPSGTWTTTIPVLAKGEWLWTRVIVYYSNGTDTTSYSVSRNGQDGNTGNGVSNVNTYFKAAVSAPATPSGAPDSSGWADNGTTLITRANADNNYHLYESTCVTYTNNTYSWSTPLDDGLISDMAATSEEFALADGPTTAPTTGWGSSVTPTTGKWIWSRTKLTFNSGNPKYINVQCVGYCGTNGTNGQDGQNGRDGRDGRDGTDGRDGQDGQDGQNGRDADFYILSPVREQCIVSATGTLSVSLTYNVIHIVGSDVTQITVDTSTNGFRVRCLPSNSSTYINFTNNTTSPSYTHGTYQTNYHTASSKPYYFTVELYNVNDQTVHDKIQVPVLFKADATLQITDSITSTVSGHTTYINSLNEAVEENTNSISQISQDYDSISSTVTSHTTYINNITGDIEDLGEEVSEIKQTADSIEANVYDNLKNKTGIDVRAGHITIDADNTTFTGNIAMENPDEGLIIKDSSGNPKINIQNNTIGNLSSFDFGLNNTGGARKTLTYSSHPSTVSTTLDAITLGTLKSGQTLRLSNMCAELYWWGKPGLGDGVTSATYSYVIKCNGATITTQSGSCTKAANHYPYEWTIPDYTLNSVSSNGTYTYTLTLSFSITNDNRYKGDVYVAATVNAHAPATSINRISTDGAVFASDPTMYNWFGSDKTELMNGKSTLRIVNGQIQRNSYNAGSPSATTYFSDISSTVPYRILNVSSHTATLDDCMIVFSTVLGSNPTRYLTLPDPGTCPGKMYFVKNITDSDTIVNCSSSQKFIYHSGYSNSNYISFGNDSSFFISCGLYWISFNCD